MQKNNHQSINDIWNGAKLCQDFSIHPVREECYSVSEIRKRVIAMYENGNRFQIEAINNSNKNIYIQSIELNGEQIHRNYITHKEIVQGGKLIFTMGEFPNKEFKSSMALSSKTYN